MEKYEYLENWNSDELVKLINEMLDFEETTKALMILEEKDIKKALELGKDIIKSNRGDDFLQATVWNIFFFENQQDMIKAVEERKKDIGKTLLNEIIIDLTNQNIVASEEFLERIRNTYMSISNKTDMCCKYEEFLKLFLITKS